MRCIFSWFTAHSWLEAGRIARDQAQILEAKSQDRKGSDASWKFGLILIGA
jgi:hypothetical protein